MFLPAELPNRVYSHYRLCVEYVTEFSMVSTAEESGLVPQIWKWRSLPGRHRQEDAALHPKRLAMAESAHLMTPSVALIFPCMVCYAMPCSRGTGIFGDGQGSMGPSTAISSNVCPHGCTALHSTLYIGVTFRSPRHVSPLPATPYSIGSVKHVFQRSWGRLWRLATARIRDSLLIFL